MELRFWFSVRAECTPPQKRLRSQLDPFFPYVSVFSSVYVHWVRWWVSHYIFTCIPCVFDHTHRPLPLHTHSHNTQERGLCTLTGQYSRTGTCSGYAGELAPMVRVREGGSCHSSSVRWSGQESCLQGHESRKAAPASSLAVALERERAGHEPCLGNTVELALMAEAQ